MGKTFTLEHNTKFKNKKYIYFVSFIGKTTEVSKKPEFHWPSNLIPFTPFTSKVGINFRVKHNV